MNRPKSITGEQANQIDYWIDGKYKIIWQLAVESGLRISDILSLKCGDVKHNPLTIYETKSRRKRKITISDKLFRYLQNEVAGGRDDWWLFQSERTPTKHIHRSTVHRRIKMALQRLDFDASCHSARKLYAQRIFKATGSAQSVQRALNHNKLSTTLAYLDLTQQDALQAHENATEHGFKRLLKFIREIFKRKEG
jgi:integrase